VAMTIVELPLDSLDLRYAGMRACRPRAEKRLLASLGEAGQQSAAVVVRGEAGQYIVIDGHKRVRALRTLRADFLKATVWEMTAPEALVAIYQLKTGAGWNALEEGWLVWELVRQVGLSPAETCRKLERSKGWLSGRLGLVEQLPEAVQEGVRAGKIGGYVATRYLLPFARANMLACEEVAGMVMAHGFCSREVAVLARTYGSARGPVREKIRADPVRFLKAVESTQGVSGLGAEEQRCLKNLTVMGNICLGLTRDLVTALGGDTKDEARSRLWPVWQQTMRRWHELSKTAQVVWVAGQKPEGS